MPRQIRAAYFSNLRLSAFFCGCFVFLLFAAVPVFAQHGGKAEPLRIEFKRGATSTAISDVVHGSEEAEYVLSAKKGQRLILKLTSTPLKSACFDLKGPDGADVGLEFDCNYDYSKLLPATGDYFLTVSRPATGKGTSKYRMTVTIR